jgi:glycosyltransferase involved in cell wall biosynthesis
MNRLLLIAPALDGEDVGEGWLAYHWARHLADRYELTVLTYHKRGRTPASQQLEGVRVIEWVEPPGLGRAERFNSMLMPGYIPFYFRARRWIQKALFSGEQFSLAYQPTPVGLRYPSPLVGFGIPFAIGPVGGSLQSPKGFEKDDDSTPWYVRLRVLDELRLKHDRMLRATYQQAECVIGIGPYVRDLLAEIPVKRFEFMSDVGIEHLPDAVDRSARRDAVRLLFVGRLVRNKGVRDAIRAVSLLREFELTLDVVGDGFDRSACEELAVELGVLERVRFHGWREPDEVQEFYQSADIFIFPSFREPGGIVVFEAMAHGLPVVVSDIGGPGAVVDETCGIRVHPIRPDQYAHELAAALAELVKDPERRQALGQGARNRVIQVGLWENKVCQLESIFSDIIAADAK